MEPWGTPLVKGVTKKGVPTMCDRTLEAGLSIMVIKQNLTINCIKWRAVIK